MKTDSSINLKLDRCEAQFSATGGLGLFSDESEWKNWNVRKKEDWHKHTDLKSLKVLHLIDRLHFGFRNISFWLVLCSWKLTCYQHALKGLQRTDAFFFLFIYCFIPVFIPKYCTLRFPKSLHDTTLLFIILKMRRQTLYYALIII